MDPNRAPGGRLAAALARPVDAGLPAARRLRHLAARATGLAEVPYLGIRRSDQPLLAANAPGVVAVRGARRYTPRPSLYVTAYWAENELNFWYALAYRLLPGHQLIPAAVAHGPGGDKHAAQRKGWADMAGAQRDAAAAALRRLGVPVRRDGAGAVVAAVDPGGPAAGVLRGGDLIVSVDGTTTRFAEAVAELLARCRPGSRVELGVRRVHTGVDDPDPAADAGAVERVTVTLGERAGRPRLGALLVTHRLTYDAPVEVEFTVPPDTAGSSAGLLLTLATLDVLTPGELTAGVPVAGTGAVTADGWVRPVSGAALKAETARRAGCRLFLVPAANADEARAGAGRMPVVAVGSVDEALAAVAEETGGDPPRLPVGG